MGGEIVEGDGECEGSLGGLGVLGRGLLSEKNRCEQAKYQTCTLHRGRDHKTRSRLIEGGGTKEFENSWLK